MILSGQVLLSSVLVCNCFIRYIVMILKIWLLTVNTAIREVLSEHRHRLPGEAGGLRKNSESGKRSLRRST